MAGDEYFKGQGQTPLSVSGLAECFTQYADFMGSDASAEEKHQKEQEFEEIVHDNPEAYQGFLARMNQELADTIELSGTVATREVFFHLGDTSGTQG